MKTYVRRQFLGGPEKGANTAYVDAYVDGVEQGWYGGAQFALHDGEHNVHLHFELTSKAEYNRSLAKAIQLAKAAENFVTALQDWDIEAHLEWKAEQKRKDAARAKASRLAASKS